MRNWKMTPAQRAAYRVVSEKARFDHVARLCAGMTEDHFDADETASFARALEHVRAGIVEVQYAELIGTSLVPVAANVNPGAEYFVWNGMDKIGIADFITNYAADFPKVNVVGGTVQSPIVAYGAGYDYSIQDLRRAAQSQRMNLGYIDIDTGRARVARESVARLTEKIVAQGNVDLGIKGLANQPLAELVPPTNGNWPALAALGTDAGKQKILADLYKCDTYMFGATLQVEAPDTLVIPTTLFNLISTTSASTLVPNVTILKVFLDNAQHIKNVVPWPYLEALDAGGTGPRLVVYKRDPSRLELVLPIEFETFPPQAVNMAFQVNCHARSGGVVLYYPKSVNYMDGCGAP